MSITISSTTDSQAEVNAAAGIEAVEEPKTPPAENTPRPQEDPDQDPDDDDDENGEEEEQPEKPEQPPQPKKKGGWLRKIEALERDRGYMARYIEQMEQALAQQRAGAPGQQQQNGHQPQQTTPDGRPSQDQFESYEQYVEALTDWKVDKRLMTEREQYAAWMQQQAEQQAVQGFQQRAGEYVKVAPDYYEAMQAVEHIPVSPALKVALVESEIGHQVAYELAKNPAELARITRLAPVHVAREVGRIEARIEARSAPEPQQKIMPSKAPAPIRPVGQGANGGVSLKLSDDMPYQDWKRVREKQIAAAKRSR